VNTLVNLESELVDLVATQVGSSNFDQELQALVTTEGDLATFMTQMASQGFGSDPLFQQDLSTVVSIEGQLLNLLTQSTSTTGQGATT
jgi:hypothetical protein